MRQFFFLVVALAATMMGGADAGTAEEFKKTYVDGLNKGLKCQKGFKSVSPRIMKATEECAKHSEITNFDCYLACLYRTYKYVKDGSNDIDYAIADIVTMESFDATTQDGRDSYWTIALNRYFCGKEYAESGNAFFPTKFDNADDCKKASSFYECQFNSMFCGNDDATSVMAKAAAR